MAEIRSCPECGDNLPPDAPEGLCPKCLLRLGLPSGAGGTTAPHPGSFQVMAPAQLSQHFPQMEILELLGQGGMGAVYKARQPGLDRMVALKILPAKWGRDPAFAERFTREARALARLNHPHIVGVYDFGQVDGLYFFVMEYVAGVNLRQTLRAGQLQPKEALAIIPQICDALQYAHEEGIVHRDIKPENILLDHKGRVKIADFGLAKLLGQAPADFALTGVHQIMGTPHYMAPEQVERPLEVDHRADIYSLGVVFYEMLTGELPLGRFVRPSEKASVDARLDEVVLKTLEKEPGRRYQNISELKTLVETITGLVAPRVRAHGYEYRSKRTLWGLPLVHIATGLDPATGRLRVAKGIIAIGDRAVGVIALGGAALGVIAVGGGAIGLLALGGGAIGLLLALGGGALGGIAVGGGAAGLVALGGGAAGYIAYGGEAAGYYAKGMQAHGVYVESLTRRDPEAVAFFQTWPSMEDVGKASRKWALPASLGLAVIMMIPMQIVKWKAHRGKNGGL
jgi:tRNA A-37 threonylcarbamoyl transferase component Bud32